MREMLEIYKIVVGLLDKNRPLLVVPWGLCSGFGPCEKDFAALRNEHGEEYVSESSYREAAPRDIHTASMRRHSIGKRALLISTPCGARTHDLWLIGPSL